MSFTDETKVCIECGNEFIFSAGEQEFHHKMGFQNIPKRCPDCRANRKAGGGQKPKKSPQNSQNTTQVRPKFRTECTECKKQFDAPFEPIHGRPVFCRECYDMKRGKKF